MEIAISKRNQYLIFLCLLFIFSFMLAYINQTNIGIKELFIATGLILTGPLSGWVLAVVYSTFISSLAFNITATTITFLPIILLVTNKIKYKKLLITCSIFFWLLSGWIFTIGIWI